jgi:hypothetical protein
MKQVITLESKELKAIVAKALNIPESNVVQQRYSIAIEGLSPEEVDRKIKALLEK